MVDSTGDLVPGLIFTSPNLKDLWEKLDAFEGEDYERVLVDVLMEGGIVKKAYIYELSEPKVFLETERLKLRQWCEADKPKMAEMQCDPEWMKNFPFVRTPEESDAQVEKLAREIDKLGFGFFALESKETREFVGFCGLHVPDWDPPFGACIEIGWGLRSAWWGRGLVTEAGNGCLKFAKDNVGLKEVYSFTTTGNTKSMAVMERIGMTRVEGGDFLHPKIDPGSPFALHVLFRIRF